ncbi:MAG: SNF2-related protein, partial [Actinomycetota bacterium]|nr:SNF2-related protein [Actinomycetota bacterium]
MHTANPELPVLDLLAVEEAVGHTSFKRGRSYARGNRVLRVVWDAQATTLTGTVVGNGALYTTEASFAPGPDGDLGFEDGGCTCPIGYDCKHVAAIVIAATDDRTAVRSVRTDTPRVVAEPRAGAWEPPLRALIDAATPQTTGNPLAIELELHPRGGPDGGPRLLARLMRTGARGGWINGSLTWNGLDSWQIHDARLRLDHVALARELYAVQQARQGRAGYFRYGAEKTLDLGSCDSPQLWSLLDDAARLGIALIHAQPLLGEIPPPSPGEVVLDMTRGDQEGSRLTAQLRIDGEDDHGLRPFLFVGASGHGIVCTQGDAAHPRLRLVRLAKPAPRQLREMIVTGDRLTIPAAGVSRFTDEIWPALRHLATVTSSDGSFTPPEISAPALVLHARYGSDHALDVGWEWAYRVGAETRRAPLGTTAAGPGFRDPAAERAILAGTALAGTGLARFGLIDDAGRPAAGPPVALSGLTSMRLTTEELPQLTERPDLAVEVSGEPADYRDLSDAVTIGVSTTAPTGERDWFDLGVTIRVDGRELPFTDVFAALSGGDEDMLLDDGGHFSLLAPHLQSLRQLIEEARALADAPPDQLRISRYQAGLWAELAALGVVTAQADTWQRQVGSLLGLETVGEHELPASVHAELRPYQHEGFGWLASLWELELGGILADDMGLGKTLQALALICHARERDPDLGPFLVVAPTSVVSNWVTEAASFAPGLTVAALTDTLARAGRSIDEVAGGADVVVTTYTLFRLDAAAYATIPWAGLLLDEAQYVKNHQGKTYKCVRELSAPFKLAITGTPMENNLMEL